MRNTIAIAFAALALTATPVAAEPAAFELRIAHADLDLTSEQDVETLRERIRTEVRKACAFPTSGSESTSIDRACMFVTTQAAMKKVEEKRAAEMQVASL